jgi:hypothetical protein
VDSQDAELLDALEELAVSQVEEEEEQQVIHLDEDSILSSSSQKPLHLQDQFQEQGRLLPTILYFYFNYFC